MKTSCPFNTININSFNPNPNPNPNSNLNPNPNPNSIPNPNSNPNPNSKVNDLRSSFANNSRNNTNKVLTRKCNRCNSLKPLTDFDENKYTCRICTSARVICQYFASIVRYDGIRAHSKNNTHM